MLNANKMWEVISDVLAGGTFWGNVNNHYVCGTIVKINLYSVVCVRQ